MAGNSKKSKAGKDAPTTDDKSDGANGASALDSLRAVELPEAPQDNTNSALDALRSIAPVEEEVDDGTERALNALRTSEVVQQQVDDGSSALDGLRAIEIAEEEDNGSQEALDALKTVEIDQPDEDTPDEALDALRVVTPDTPMQDDRTKALDELRATERVELTEVDTSQHALETLSSQAPEPKAPEADNTAALDALRHVETPQEGEEDRSADVLAALEAPVEVVKGNDAAVVLARLDTPDFVEEVDRSDEILAGLDSVEDPAGNEDITTTLAGLEAPAEIEQIDETAVALAGLDPVEEVSEEDTSAAILADLDAPDVPQDEDKTDATLASLEPPAVAESVETPEEVLAGLEAPKPAPQEPTAADALADLELPPALTNAEETLAVSAVIASIGQTPVEEQSDNTEDVLAGLDSIEEQRETDDHATALANLEPAKDIEEESAADDILAGLEPAVADVEEETPDVALATLQTSPDLEKDEHTGDALAELDAVDTSEVDTHAGLETNDPEPSPVAGVEVTKSDAGNDVAHTHSADHAENESIADASLTQAEADPVPKDITPDKAAEDDIENLLPDLEGQDDDEDLDSLLASLEEDPSEVTSDSEGLAQHDTAAPLEPQASDDLDAILATLDADVGDMPEDDAIEPDTDADDLDVLLGELMGDAELLAAGEGEDVPEMVETNSTTEAPRSAEPELAFGQMTADRPAPQKLERKRFRLAILGDFTGRSARGVLEVGDDLAIRPAIMLDLDTVEEVIESFATTLVLPVGKDGAGVEVKLTGLDDLHPDELFENVEIFSALRDLKAQLAHGGTAESAAKSLMEWGKAHGRPVKPAKATSSGNTLHAGHKLSDFQKLIGDTGATLAQASPLDEMLARIVGPHIRKIPDADATAMAQAVDDALSDAMRLILHHPEFQSVESQWRAIDLIVRSIETDENLDVMLYDVSAEEIAADLTQSDDLAQSGLMRMLTDTPMDAETGRGAYSALIGMYNFEETPPHAQLLGRIARVAAHVHAPFFAAISTTFMDTPQKNRHPLVAAEWDALRAMPEAKHLALVTPRFLLRRPYGAKSEPIYEFEFEEFTQRGGLSGMLWANPVVLVSILLAKSFKENGTALELGQIMSLGDMPYHFVKDRYGDIVALPCTERNLTTDKVETVLGRGYLPVISAKGRDEIRLGSFQSLGGGEILGPWSGDAPPPSSQVTQSAATTQDAEDELDALLAEFDQDADEDDENDMTDEIEAELAALLADL